MNLRNIIFSVLGGGVIVFSSIVICFFTASAEVTTGNFYLSGNLKGLRGGELTLELNGLQTLTISADGDFAFKAPIPEDQKYAVTIKKMPLNHRCEVLKDQQTKSPADKKQIDIICRETGRWQHPGALTDAVSPLEANAGMTAVAVNDNGEALVVWSQYDGAYWRIHKREYRDGKWQNSTTSNSPISPAVGHARKPKVAMAKNGDVVIVWEQEDPDNNFIMMAERRRGAWKQPGASAGKISVGKKYAWEAEVAINDSGETVIVWSQESETGIHQIYKSEYSNGKWQHPLDIKDHISPSSSNDALRPQVGINNNGDVVIAWEQDIDGVSRIFKSELIQGKWKHPVDRNDFISPRDDGIRSGAYHARVAIDAKKNVVIVWQQHQGAKNRIYISENRHGIWHNPASLADAISPSTHNAATINDVSIDGEYGIILWSDYKERKHALYKSEYFDGRWHHTDRGNPFVSAPRSWAFKVMGWVAVADNDKAVISWLYKDHLEKARVSFAEHDNGEWYFSDKVLNIANMPASELALSTSHKGNFIIAWQQGEGKNNQIFSSVFTVIE